MSVSSPLSAAVDQLSDLALWEAELAGDPRRLAEWPAGRCESTVESLAQRLARVPDPRAAQGRRHPIGVILALTACATLVAGNDSVAAIWQWAAGVGQDVLARLGARYDGWSGRYVVPSERTFRRVLATVDGDILDGQIRGYLTDVIRGAAPTPALPAPPGPPRPLEREQRRAASGSAGPAELLAGVAIDGKLLQGTLASTDRVVLVAAIEHRTGIVLGQRQVPDKTNEITAVSPLLTALDLGWDLTGKVLTFDALHTNHKTARLITATLNAHYILILKDNQANTLHAARQLLPGTGPHTGPHTDIHTDRGHGRIEQRTLHTTPTGEHLFPGARQAFRLHRHVKSLDHTPIRTETIHGITSLPAELATAAHLNHYIRHHWHIENRLHWIRDVTFNEDRSALRTGTAPRNLATLRNLAISTYRLAGRANIAHARRELRHHPDAFTVYGI